MIKKTAFLLLLLMISTVSFSNTVIFGKHKDKEKDGAKVNCIYCHNTVKIEKKKGQLQDKKLNGTKLAMLKTCNGAGCHK